MRLSYNYARYIFNNDVTVWVGTNSQKQFMISKTQFISLVKVHGGRGGGVGGGRRYMYFILLL